MIVGLSVSIILLVIFGYCMIDGRNVTIKHLRGDLERRNASLDKAQRERDALKIEKDQQVHKVRREYEDKLQEKDARIEKIVTENSRIQWSRELRDRQRYNVTISVNPELLQGIKYNRDDLMYIAKYLGDQVAYEFGSLKFIEKANEDERWHAEEARRRRPYTF